MNGWNSYTDATSYDWNGTTQDIYGQPAPTIPISTHQFGLSAANFLSTPTQNAKPYNSATFAPVSGSSAIGAASTITDADAVLLPVRMQYDMELARVKPRTTLTTLGAVDVGGQPTLTSLALTPASVLLLSSTANNCSVGGSPACLPTTTGAMYVPVQLGLLGTWSDGLISEVSPDATWTAPGLTFYSNNEFLPNSVAPLSGTVTATYGGQTATQPYAYDGATVPSSGGSGGGGGSTSGSGTASTGPQALVGISSTSAAALGYSPSASYTFTAGNTGIIVYGAKNAGATPPVMACTNGVTATLLGYQQSVNSYANVAAYVILNAPGGLTTCAPPSGVNYSAMMIAEFSGSVLGTESVVSANTGTASAINCSTVTTTGPTRTVLSAGFLDAGTLSAASGFSSVFNIASANSLSLFSMAVPTASATAVTISSSGTDGNEACLAFALTH